jgi:hypothetical protein
MRKATLTYLFGLMILVAACKKDKSGNPYDNWNTNGKSPVITNKPVDPNTIQGLHKNIFKPTCSNSGCHDGNFEPDFRSIESSYNSLVNRLSTNIDPANQQYVKRVSPGNASTSMLLHRILDFIPGTQGKMPLLTDPGSDWPAKKEEYIQNIRNWINNGAKDQFGNNPSDLDFIPQPAGLLVFLDGSSTPLPHPIYEPVQVPSGGVIKIMVAYSDDKTAVKQFGPSTINFSLNPNSYDSMVQPLVKESQAFIGLGVLGANVDYWHSVNINVNELGKPGDVIWVRTETTDNVNLPVYIPSSESSFNLKKYFAIKIN